jgi:hypothetical protein
MALIEVSSVAIASTDATRADGLNGGVAATCLV